MATTQFIAEGGDGYDFFTECTNISSAETGPEIIDTLVNYIRTKCSGQISLKKDGRISFL